MIKLIDTHCHLNDKAFKKDIADVISRAIANGVYKILVMGVDESTSVKAVTLADTYKEIFALGGFQPQEKPYPTNLNYLETLASKRLIKGIGEIGIDLYWEENEPFAKQEALFIKQLEIAQRFNLPVSIHARSAISEVINILKKFTSVKGIIHCFTEGVAEAQAILTNSNLYFGIGGVLTYKNATSLREAVKIIPLEKIVLETDAPYLAPQKYRGQRNEPSFILEVTKALAAIKNISLEQVAEVTTQNAITLFNLEED